jgi:type IV secretory pathway TrbF-like protein
MSDTTHSLTEARTGEWELHSQHRHHITKLLTTIRAVTPETAMTRAEIWLRIHHPPTQRLGHRWAKSRGYSRRWVLRTA